ncbi:VWA domain-containing protein [Corynebacterium doosanense]|uniref:von Willebrand factor A n=1 Tax=Corynebacterium doosanense CAU 212 = DSM 45436 TaxID=558173 RepID=A0A097IDW1_9CORY|nr:VWA domain-containing protein [Corynebacterium doosanense]AIT60312.1 von Willebrand factor A [Corynebacterium doosanense CAU 212 = DSM 45436]
MSETSKRDRRWALVLGTEGRELTAEEKGMSDALGKLYDHGRGQRKLGGGNGAPRVSTWLSDIRTFFPASVVEVVQADALNKLGLRAMLNEPGILDNLEPDLELVTTLAEMSSLIPEDLKAKARQVVQTVVDDIEKRIRQSTEASVRGALDRAARTRRPRHVSDIDFDRTIRANLGNYSPELGTVIPEKLVGYRRRNTGIEKEVVLAIDQSGSMAESIIYSSVFAAVLGSIRSLKTSLVAFDTEIADLTDRLADPVDVIFGTQLGGGTDINRAVAYCSGLITSPTDSVFILISDLYENGVRSELLSRMHELKERGVIAIVLLALSDSGAPAYDKDLAAELRAMDIPAFACTPDLFPELFAAAVAGDDLAAFVDHSREED